MSKFIVCSGDTVDVDGVPKEIKILPLGLVHSQKGDFSVDDESVEMIRQQFKDRKLGLSTLFQTNFFRLFFRYCTGV